MDNTYMDLAARLEDSFPDVENEVIMDMRENNEDYAALRGEISDIENKHNFIGRVLNGSGEVHLTEEEHKVLTEYLRLRFNLDVARSPLLPRAYGRGGLFEEDKSTLIWRFLLTSGGNTNIMIAGYRGDEQLEI